ncbi:MAG: aminotransferase class V-fold PLP-dependent enzyme [Gemmatimonadales bacterium]
MRILSGSETERVEADRARFAALRETEFSRLEEEGHAYLDYTGSGLHARCQLERYRALIEHALIGNPHSHNPASVYATELIERSRARVLEFFSADPAAYTVIFTANASAAIKLVGESFPFRADSVYALLEDNHNSVNGLVEYAKRVGATIAHLPLDAELRLDSATPRPEPGAGPSLFAFPAQSNFSGVRHPLALVDRARSAGYRVLLDAAAFAPTSRLDLGKVKADFVCLSFYKMFGFPTGVGALIARHEALAELERPWFAGGTVDFVSVQLGRHQLRRGAEAFEDGTPNFLGIGGVVPGLEFLEQVGVDAIGRWVRHLTARLLDGLRALRHADGSPMVALYGPDSVDDRGGTVAFNLLRPSGDVIEFEAIEREAGTRKIHLRGGCFCNPGAAEIAFGFPADRTADCLDRLGPGEFSVERFGRCLGPGYAAGALRASLGVASNEEDIDRLLAFLAAFAARP